MVVLLRERCQLALGHIVNFGQWLDLRCEPRRRASFYFGFQDGKYSTTEKIVFAGFYRRCALEVT